MGREPINPSGLEFLSSCRDFEALELTTAGQKLAFEPLPLVTALVMAGLSCEDAA
jgi:hypothetical protein